MAVKSMRAALATLLEKKDAQTLARELGLSVAELRDLESGGRLRNEARLMRVLPALARLLRDPTFEPNDLIMEHRQPDPDPSDPARYETKTAEGAVGGYALDRIRDPGVRLEVLTALLDMLVARGELPLKRRDQPPPAK